MHWSDFIDPGNSGGSVRIPEFPKFQSKAVVWSCNECGEEFPDQEALRAHKIEEHPLRRPSLQIKGVPLKAQRFVIHSPITPEDICFENVDHVVIDGSAKVAVDIAAKKIASVQRGRTELALSYRDYTILFYVDVEILDSDVAVLIEKAFFECRIDNSLSKTLGTFNSRVRDISGGKAYIAALQAYITAIMAKDALEGVAIASKNYGDKLGEALDGLDGLDRPLAEALVALISYMRNDFRRYPGDLAFPFLAEIKSIYRTGVVSAESSRPASGGFEIPLDSITEFLAVFLTSSAGYRLRAAKDVKNLMSSSLANESDREKLTLALLVSYIESGEEHFFWDLYHKSEHLPGVITHAKKYIELVESSSS